MNNAIVSGSCGYRISQTIRRDEEKMCRKIKINDYETKDK